MLSLEHRGTESILLLPNPMIPRILDVVIEQVVKGPLTKLHVAV